MYQISRAIYRELAPNLGERCAAGGVNSSHEHVLHACEGVIERLARDPYCFADPTRTLFCDIRSYFPMNAQEHVHRVVSLYMGIAQRFVAENPLAGYAAISGEPPRCRATTRKGDACRRLPLPQNGYCPSHQHLATTEDGEWALERLRVTDRRARGRSESAGKEDVADPAEGVTEQIAADRAEVPDRPAGIQEPDAELSGHEDALDERLMVA